MAKNKKKNAKDTKKPNASASKKKGSAKKSKKKVAKPKSGKSKPAVAKPKKKAAPKKSASPAPLWVIDPMSRGIGDRRSPFTVGGQHVYEGQFTRALAESLCKRLGRSNVRSKVLVGEKENLTETQRIDRIIAMRKNEQKLVWVRLGVSDDSPNFIVESNRKNLREAFKKGIKGVFNPKTMYAFYNQAPELPPTVYLKSFHLTERAECAGYLANKQGTAIIATTYAAVIKDLDKSLRSQSSKR